jgi:hypothetical protein
MKKTCSRPRRGAFPQSPKEAKSRHYSTAPGIYSSIPYNSRCLAISCSWTQEECDDHERPSWGMSPDGAQVQAGGVTAHLARPHLLSNDCLVFGLRIVAGYRYSLRNEEPSRGSGEDLDVWVLMVGNPRNPLNAKTLGYPAACVGPSDVVWPGVLPQPTSTPSVPEGQHPPPPQLKPGGPIPDFFHLTSPSFPQIAFFCNPK